MNFYVVRSERGDFNDADSGPPRYVLWCCGGIFHDFLTFFSEWLWPYCDKYVYLSNKINIIYNWFRKGKIFYNQFFLSRNASYIDYLIRCNLTRSYFWNCKQRWENAIGQYIIFKINGWKKWSMAYFWQWFQWNGNKYASFFCCSCSNCILNAHRIFCC